MKNKRELCDKFAISLSKKDRQRAKDLSFKIFGKVNVSGLFAYYINKDVSNCG